MKAYVKNSRMVVVMETPTDMTPKRNVWPLVKMKAEAHEIFSRIHCSVFLPSVFMMEIKEIL